MFKLVFIASFAFIACRQPHDKIIMQATDERGLTSVIYTQGKDTFALDYLTHLQIDSLNHSFIHF